MEIPWAILLLGLLTNKTLLRFHFDDNTFMSPCPCNSPKRFSRYLDPQIVGITPDLKVSSLTDIHIRTMDIEIVRDHGRMQARLYQSRQMRESMLLHFMGRKGIGGNNCENGGG